MNAVRDVLGFVVFLYFLVLIGRVVFDWIRIFAREWRPRGAALLVAEPIYTLTEPPLRALRKVIPPLRLGGVEHRPVVHGAVLHRLDAADPALSSPVRQRLSVARGGLGRPVRPVGAVHVTQHLSRQPRDRVV